jgi:hypothetical protein
MDTYGNKLKIKMPPLKAGLAPTLSRGEGD